MMKARFVRARVTDLNRKACPSSGILPSTGTLLMLVEWTFQKLFRPQSKRNALLTTAGEPPSCDDCFHPTVSRLSAVSKASHTSWAAAAAGASRDRLQIVAWLPEFRLDFLVLRTDH
jgi:hypothetical protein